MLVQSTKDVSTQRLKFLIYGQAGVGKTSLAATLTEKTLIISSEAGLLSLAGHDIDVIDLSVDAKGNEVPRHERAARLGEIYQFICSDAAKEKYKWIFIDSLTEIGQNVVEALQKVYPDKKDGLNLWGEYSKQMRSIVKTFRDLPFYNVVFTALQKVETDENNRRFLAIDVQGKISNQLPGYFDEVLWMHVEDDENKTRRIMTEALDTIPAKDRSGRLDRYELPNLQMIANKIRTEKTNQPTKGK